MKTLAELLEWAKSAKMTPAQLAEQRRSFAYGNCKIENDLITRAMVAEEDRKLFPDA